jgi:hypothetical protein
MWLKPITDRTSEDIVNRTSKAFFNVVDWVRIYGNASIVAALINFLHNAGIDYETLPEPTCQTIPTVTEYNHFLEVINVAKWEKYVNAILSPINTQYVEGAGGTSPNYEDINEIERNIEIMRSFILRQMHYLVYAGVGAAGQSRMWQIRFRMFAFVPDSPTPVRRPRTGVTQAGIGMRRQNAHRRYL